MLKHYHDLQTTMSELQTGESGTLHIGVMEPIASFRMPHIVKSFKTLYPKVDISFTIQSNHMMNQIVSKGEVDFAICSTPDSGAGNIFEPVHTEKVGLLMPEGHHLAAIDELYLHHLRNEHILITHATCPFRKQLESELHDKGGTPYSSIEIGNILALRYYVQSEYGLAVVPLISTDPPPPGTLIRPVADLDEGLTIGILQKKDSSLLTTAARRFREHIVRELPA